LVFENGVWFMFLIEDFKLMAEMIMTKLENKACGSQQPGLVSQRGQLPTDH
jgi:hypothetical protein